MQTIFQTAPALSNARCRCTKYYKYSRILPQHHTSLQYVSIVTYPCKLLFSKKKKKKTRTSVRVKMPKLCHNTPLSIFSLGKGRESLRLKTLCKKLSKSALSALPPACKHSNSDNVWMTHIKISQNKSTFPQISHLSSNRRVRNLAFYFQFTTPASKLTHRTKFEHVWMQKDMNFGNAIILCYFRPEKCQNPTQKKTRILETP